MSFQQISLLDLQSSMCFKFDATVLSLSLVGQDTKTVTHRAKSNLAVSRQEHTVFEVAQSQVSSNLSPIDKAVIAGAGPSQRSHRHSYRNRTPRHERARSYNAVRYSAKNKNRQEDGDSDDDDTNLFTIFSCGAYELRGLMRAAICPSDETRNRFCNLVWSSGVRTTEPAPAVLWS